MTKYTFKTCGHGIIPKFHGAHFNAMFSEWQHIRKWCEDQGWEMGTDFMANAEIGKPWYFRTTKQRLWFAMKWCS